MVTLREDGAALPGHVHRHRPTRGARHPGGLVRNGAEPAVDLGSLRVDRAVLEGRIDRVVITAVEEKRHFFANLELERDGQRRVLAARPSDGIALALRAEGAEIFVDESVMAETGIAPASEHSN